VREYSRTVEWVPVPRGTSLRFPEHVAFLEGTESASGREQATAHLDRLRKYLSRGAEDR
jgi:hypothetical protein